MDPLTLINILMHAVGAVPAVQSDMSAALKANWSRGVVQDFVQGVSVLNSLVNDVAGQVAPAEIAVAEPVTGIGTVTPPPPAPGNGG